MNKIFVLLLLIVIVILVFTILNYTKKVVKSVSAGTSNVTVEETNGNAVISVTGGSGSYLPLSGGTMTAGGTSTIDMNNSSILNASEVSTLLFTLSGKQVIYGLNSSVGTESQNLFFNGVANATSLLKIPDGFFGIAVFPAYNGEQWIFPSTYSGGPLVTLNIYVNSTATQNTYSVPNGFYLNLINRRPTTGLNTPITLKIYSIEDPENLPVILPVSTDLPLLNSSQAYLYWDGTSWTLN